LDLDERRLHEQAYRLHQDLLKLRREDAVLRQQAPARLDGAPLGPDCLLLRYFGGAEGDRLLIANFGRDLRFSPAPQPLLAPPRGQSWQWLFSSEDVAYGGLGARPWEEEGVFNFPGETTLVLSASPAAACGPAPSPPPPP
jgi:maltooligosyltrehalose trehalohydrolase